jgi:copper oxidase (laccase) domain-containing protein
MAHLPGLVQLELERLGVQRLFGNLAQMHTPTQPQVPDPWCTVTNTEDFFSYRRQGVCGRFAASIWLDEPQPQP